MEGCWLLSYNIDVIDIKTRFDGFSLYNISNKISLLSSCIWLFVAFWMNIVERRKVIFLGEPNNSGKLVVGMDPS